ncbi:WYL domain-containing protein [Nostoc sp. 'Peltigera membranacea cyanobiont' N6]|uniref:WYL domain-containing protein n=1 Tax=Nostoc sp. 'Peltigera membranacea cyanobiont' N6 TaxID=1261031 RepID=UPI0011B0CE82|nr:WYL domain-containing protein [Nostoc sp. 'Peltigera membranacea cyanobiont' N6]
MLSPEIGIIYFLEFPKIHSKPTYVDYIVKLPKRSLEEFCRWVYRFMGNAQFISPQHLAEQHQKFARALINRYSSKAPIYETALSG